MQGTFSSTQTSKISSNCWIANRNDHFHAKIRQNDHILGLLGGIEIRYWNLVLVFPLGKKSIRNFNTSFFSIPPSEFFVNFTKNFSEYCKISSISQKKNNQNYTYCVKMSYFDGKICFLFVNVLFSRKKLLLVSKNTIRILFSAL